MTLPQSPPKPQPLATWYVVLVCALLGVVIIALLCGRNRIALATVLAVVLVQCFGMVFVRPRHLGAQVCITDSETTAIDKPARLPVTKHSLTRTMSTPHTLSFLQAWKQGRKRRPSKRLTMQSSLSAAQTTSPKTKQMRAVTEWWNQRAQDPDPRMRRAVPSRARTLDEHKREVEARHVREQERRTRRRDDTHSEIVEFENKQQEWHNAMLTRELIEPGLSMSEDQRSELHRRSMIKQRGAVRGPSTYIGRITNAARRRASKQ